MLFPVPICGALATTVDSGDKLRVPHVQVTFERLGYRLLGFVPGYDREEVSPGNVKRVCEAVYGKVLVPTESMLQPDMTNLTPAAKALFEKIFPNGFNA